MNALLFCVVLFCCLAENLYLEFVCRLEPKLSGISRKIREVSGQLIDLAKKKKRFLSPYFSQLTAYVILKCIRDL